MARVRVHTLAISLDGCVAGPDQSLTNPLGIGGERLHDWVFATRSARETHGQEGGADGIDNDWVARGEIGIGATIVGRNMFGPIREPWPDEEWVGWWDNVHHFIIPFSC